MKILKKRILSLLLILVMVAGILQPMTAEAIVSSKLEQGKIKAVTVSDTSEGEASISAIYDGNPETFWTSSSAVDSAYLIVELDDTYNLTRIDYSPRYFYSDENPVYWECTGNIKKIVLQISADGDNWTTVTPEGGLILSDWIGRIDDSTLFPVSVSFEETAAKYVKVTAIESFHWQTPNSCITVGDIAVYAVSEQVSESVDRTSLDTAISEAEALHESDYTAESWAVLADAIAAANELSMDADQIAVDAAANAIIDAMAALIERGDDSEVTYAYGNVALNKTVIAALNTNQTTGILQVGADSNDRPLTMAVDGVIETNNYADIAIKENDVEIRGSAYIQVDLGQDYDVDKLSLYRYWEDGRTYDATVIVLAKNEADFGTAAQTIVYNSDTENVHGLGEGSDDKYVELSSGRTWILDEAAEARYIRVYVNGNNNKTANTNHIVELQAWAYAEVLPAPEPALRNAETYQDFPTHYQDRTTTHVGGQVTHPDVVYVEDGWNGYKYWVIYTPNTMVTSQYENPYIAASNDGVNWYEPTGISNPIEPEPVSTRFHNCDADMIYNKEMDAMMAYWNWADDNGNLGAAVRVRISYDGIHWGVPSTYNENTGIWEKPENVSERTLKDTTYDSDGLDNSFITAIASNDRYDMLSPTFTYDSYRDIYVMWANNTGNVGYNNGQNNHVDIRWSEDGLNWSEPKPVNNFLDKTTDGLQLAPWHQDVNYIPELKEYWALSQCFTGNNPDGSMLYLTTSKDGINWEQVGTEAILNPGETGEWDDFQIYRSCFVYDNDTLRVWYSALQADTANQLVVDSSGNKTIQALSEDTRIWRIGYTENTYEGIMGALTGNGTKPELITGTTLGLTAEETELSVGNNTQVSVSFTPANTSDQIVKYTSSDEDVLTVTPFGEVIAVGEGTATVTAETRDQIGAAVEITVGAELSESVPAGVEWYDVPFDCGEIVYDEGWQEDSLGKYCYTQGSKATLVFYGTGIKWIGQKDSNFGEAIVVLDGEEYIVNANGSAATNVEHFALENLSKGLHTITIAPKEAGVLNQSGCIDIARLVVQYDKTWDIDVSSVTASVVPGTIFVGMTATITARIQPFNANNKTLVFESIEETVATVSSEGIIAGVAAGEARINVIADGTATEVILTVKDTEVPSPRRITIDNENPLLIVPVYGQSYHASESEMQWGDTLIGRWNSLPDDIKANCVIVIHAGRIANGSLKAFYMQQLEIAEENDIPVMLVTATAGLHSQWTSTTDIAYDDTWLESVMQTYDSLKGFVITENYWTSYDTVATQVANHLEIAAENGGYVIWFEHQTQVIENILQNSAFKTSLAEYGDSFAFTWKNTPANANQNAETSAYMQGLWLAGVIDQWGGLMDTWKWYEKSYGKLFQGTVSYIGTSQDTDGEECRAVVMEPEALLGIEMLSIYANGGVIYSFEHPAYTQGINDNNTPLFDNVIYETFKYILEYPTQSREEVLEDTAVVLHGNLSSDSNFHTGLTSDDQTLPTHSSGRYGLLPAVPAAVSTGSIPADKIVALSTLSSMSTAEKKAYLDPLYETGAYEGNAFVQSVHEAKIFYNSKINENVTQSATFFVRDQSVEVVAEPHTFAVLRNENGKISAYVNNYRVNKDEIWNGYNSNTIKWDPDVNTIMQDWLTDNYMTNPVDGQSTYRVTVFTLTDMDSEPVVAVTHEKENDFEVDINYNSETKEAEITITSNGYIHFTIDE